MKQNRSLVFFLLVAVFRLSLGINICPTREVTVNNAELTITSPNWPDNYPPNTNCNLKLSTSIAYVFVVKFTDFELEEDEDNPDECQNVDFLKLIDGQNQASYCREEIPSNYESASNKLNLQFKSNGNWEYQGFRLRITTKISSRSPPAGAQSICGIKSIIRKKKFGSFISPNFPRLYSNNANCNATVRVPDNFMTTVWFEAFELEGNGLCKKDSLKVKDELQDSTLCGNTLPSPLYFYGHSVTVAFKSNSRVTAGGFHMKYNMTRLKKGECMCFNGLEYITVSKFNRKTLLARDEIKFRFKTRRADGLIVYSKGTLPDYIYIALQGGTLFYEGNLGTGSGRAVVAGARLNDNKWHKVLIRRRGRRLSINVDRGKYKATRRMPGRFKKLNIPNSVGHVLGTPSDKRILSNFVGCIKHFYIDGREPLTNAWAGKPDYKFQGKSTVKLC